MRIYKTNRQMELENEAYCIYVTDCKELPDGTKVPREGVCMSGVDFEERFLKTNGVPCVLAYTVITYRGSVSTFGHCAKFDSDEEAIAALVTGKGLSIVKE